ncbi:MAG: hypothetical protein MR720_05890 [Sutterella sp.]|nr:hypothetical protein [Sutterella sp.]
MSGEISLCDAAQTYKFSLVTVRTWRDRALADNMPATLTTQMNRMN